MGRAGWCQEALPSKRLHLCTEAAVWELEVAIMVGPEMGTGLVPMERWSVGWDDLDGELGNGFWQSAPVECLCSQICFVNGREGSVDQGTAEVRVFLVWLLQKGHLCSKTAGRVWGSWSECESQAQWDTLSCCGWTGLPRADVHTTWEGQRA